MKLLLNIDDDLFQKVHRLTKAKTKKEAIVISMKAYLERHKRRTLSDLIGNYEHDQTLAQLKKQRAHW